MSSRRGWRSCLSIPYISSTLTPPGSGVAGTLSLEELKAALTKDAGMTEADCDMLFKIADKNNNTELTMMEFQKGMKKWATGAGGAAPTVTISIAAC